MKLYKYGSLEKDILMAGYHFVCVIAILTVLFSVTFGFTPTYLSFNNGQVSPLMEARVDYQKYSSSCRTIENMFVTPQGSAVRRPGTYYVADANTDSADVIRLIPFEYSTDDAYVLEFSDNSLRMFRDE